jgi:rare lipoprotein A (peptidoglycan hydrolase)
MRQRRTIHGVLGLGVLLAIVTSFLSKGKTTEHALLDRTTAVAIQVARYSRRAEQQEGRHDLVKDSVRTKTTTTGKTIIEQIGEASFYGQGFHGRLTANGTRFNRHGLTAAHPTLPLGTRAQVTNLKSGQTVSVQITDRGPYAKGRDLDLSQAAAAKVGLTQKNGEAPVKIEATLPPPEEQRKIAATQGPTSPREMSQERGGRRPRGKG